MFRCSSVFGISYFAIGKAYNLIQNTQSIPHAAFTFLGNHLQGCFVCFYFFFINYFLQVFNRIIGGDAFEIKYLATA